MYHNIPGCEVLKAIEIAIPAMAIEEAIAKTKTTEERKRSLPAQLVVSLVIALSFCRTYAVPLHMAHKFVFFKILPLPLVPLRKSCFGHQTP